MSATERGAGTDDPRRKCRWRINPAFEPGRGNHNFQYPTELICLFLEIRRVLAYIGCRVFVRGARMPRPPTLRQKIEQRIARKKGEDVFLTREFKKLGGEDQVVRALRELVEDGRLV